MQQGSLITPSERFLREIPLANLRHPIQYTPKIPEKGDVYVCAGLYKVRDMKGKMIQAVKVEDFKITHPDVGELHLNSYLWEEVQPPMKVDINEILSTANEEVG